MEIMENPKATIPRRPKLEAIATQLNKWQDGIGFQER